MTCWPAGIPKSPPNRSGIEFGQRHALGRQAQRRIIIWLVWILAFYAVGLFSTFCAIIAFGSALMVISALRARQRSIRAQESARLLSDCHYQHAAWLKGGSEDAFAFFGGYQPAGLDGKILWCSPSQAFPQVARDMGRVADFDPAFADGSLVAHGGFTHEGV